MLSPTQIIPAILSDSLDTVQMQLDAVIADGRCKVVQIDVVDSDYADELTVSPIDLVRTSSHGLSIDLHLMTNDPINDVNEATSIPNIRSVIGQIEHMGRQEDFIAHVQSYQLKVGLSIDLYTPLESLEPESLRKLDIVQIMGIKAGAQGRMFAGDIVLQKITDLRKLRGSNPEKYHWQILVDGGMNPATISACENAGADVFVVGSELWKTAQFSPALELLLQTS